MISISTISRPRYRLDIYHLAAEFHGLAMGAVPPLIRGSNRLRSRIEKETSNAHIGIGNAADGLDAKGLAVAQACLHTSLMLLEQLVAQQRVAPDSYARLHAMARRILERISELTLLPADEWSAAKPVASGRQDERAMLSDPLMMALRAMVARIRSPMVESASRRSTLIAHGKNSSSAGVGTPSKRGVRREPSRTGKAGVRSEGDSTARSSAQGPGSNGNSS